MLIASLGRGREKVKELKAQKIFAVLGCKKFYGEKAAKASSLSAVDEEEACIGE